MKKIISILLAACLLLAMVGCGEPAANQPTTQPSGTPSAPAQNESTAPSETLVLTLGTQADPTHYSIPIWEAMNEELMELSGGTMRIEIVPNGQLGTITEEFAQVKAGNQDMVASGWTDLSLLPGGKDFSIFCLPFLFDDYDHVERFCDSSLFTEMLKEVGEANNMVCLGITGTDPIRQLTTAKKPVYSVSDLNGLVIRVPSTPLQTQVWLDFGANATQSSYPDLLDGLQTGRFDGQENGLTIVSSGALSYQDYYMELNHTYGAAVYWISQATWDKMTEEQRGWLQQAHEEVYINQDYINYVPNVLVPEYQKQLEKYDNLTIIHEDELDRQSFVDCVASHMSEYEGEYFSEGLYDQIRAMATK